jgi:hypothetical protein
MTDESYYITTDVRIKCSVKAESVDDAQDQFRYWLEKMMSLYPAQNEGAVGVNDKTWKSYNDNAFVIESYVEDLQSHEVSTE